MPTAAKLVAAVLIAALGYYVASLIVPRLPEQTDEGLLREVTAVLGLLVGWRFLGPRMGGGYNFAIGLGLSASLVLTVSSLIAFSGYEMIVRSLRKSYDGPFEALQGMMDIAIDDLVYLQFPEVLAALILGGILAGFLTEFAARRWS